MDRGTGEQTGDVAPLPAVSHHSDVLTGMTCVEQRSPFNHKLFFSMLCSLHRRANSKLVSLVQTLYANKRVLEIIFDSAFSHPASEIDLIDAAENGRIAELWDKLQLTKVDINSQGSAAVHVAAAKGKTEALQLLLQYGGDPNIANQNGQTPLCLAAYFGKAEVVQLMLQYGGDPNRADNDGDTPVYVATVYDNFETLQLLLKYGGDPNKANNDGDAAMHFAVSREASRFNRVVKNKVVTILKAAAGRNSPKENV